MNKRKKGACGTKIFKKGNPLVAKPTKKTDKDNVNDKKKTITIWLVNAMPKGIKLIRLQSKINKNKVKINGK
jgi:hypothetical protein